MKQTIKQVFGILLFAMLSLSGFAQQANVTIKGTVKDNAGVLLPGVNIIEKGTKNAVTTDFDGKYSLTVNKGAVLVFSYLGMKTVSKTVGDQKIIDIAMVDGGDTALNEVIVTGYGKQKKGNLTNAVSTVNMADIQDLPVGDVGTAIQGRVLGVGVSGGSTRPGVKSTLTIRNPYSFTGNTTPLYVIDGVLQVDAQGKNDTTLYDNLDSSEIESISFLKDGAAAIYGARSALGVVLITTKRGMKGEPKFTYSGSYAVNDKTYQTKVLNAYEFGQYVNIMNGKNGYNRTSTDKQYFFSGDEMEYFKTLDNNFLDDEWSSSYNMRHTLNVSGGTDKATYFAGGAFFKQNGNLATLDYDKWNFRAGADVNLSSNWKAGLQLSGYYSDQTKTFNKIGGENDENDYNELLLRVPYIPNYVNGLPIELANNNDGTQRYHFNEIKRLNNLAETSASTTTVNLYAEYKVPFIKGLSAKVSYARNMGNTRGSQIGTGYTLYQFTGIGTNEHIFNDNITSAPLRSKFYENGNRLYFANTKTLSEQQNVSFSYDRTLGKHAVSAIFVAEKAESISNKEEVYKTAVVEGTNGQFNTASGTIDGSTGRNETASLSYIGRANYAYNDKYMAEFLFRTDASTKFAPENYWGKFYNIGAGWVISKENFFKSNVIDYLKVRYSAGLLGKDDTNAWLWRQRYDFQANKGIVLGGNADVNNGWKIGASPNPDARWSQDVKTNFGIDARFLKNRLSFGFERFYNISTNQLISRTGDTPFTVGGGLAPENYGEVDTFGYEFSLGWSDTVGKDIKYGIDLRFGWSDNKVYKGNFNSAEVLYPWTAKVGESSDFGTWGYDNLGMFKTQDDINNYVSTYGITEVFGTVAAQLKPGMLYYRDVRGAYLGNGEFAPADGKIDVNDQVQLAERSNTRYGTGATLRFAYKSFSINTVVNASFGGGWNEISGTARKSLKSSIPQIADNTVSIWNDIYDPELNPNGKMPNPAFESINTVTSQFWQVDAFSIVCRNITLSYGMPEKGLKFLNLSSFKLNLIALNPFILYNPYTFQEPTGSFKDYPTLRTISLGLNIGF